MMYIVIDDNALSRALYLMRDDELAKAVKSVINKAKVEPKQFCEVITGAMKEVGKK